MAKDEQQKKVFGYGAAVFGVAIVVAMLVLAVKFPNPTSSQQDTFRIVLALAAAGVGAMLPGSLSLDFKPHTRVAVQAGGALALFAIVFFFNPAARVSGEPVLDATVPDVIALPKDEALSLIDSAGLVAAPVCEEAYVEADPGTVFATTPVAGKQVESGSEVQLLINPPC